MDLQAELAKVRNLLQSGSEAVGVLDELSKKLASREVIDVDMLNDAEKENQPRDVKVEKDEEEALPSEKKQKVTEMAALMAMLPTRIDCGFGAARTAAPPPMATSSSPELSWPNRTPIPEASGGEFVEIGRGKGKRVRSRVGRLVGHMNVTVDGLDRGTLTGYDVVGQGLVPAWNQMKDPDLLVVPFGVLASRGRLRITDPHDAAAVDALRGLCDCDNPFHDRCVYMYGFVPASGAKKNDMCIVVYAKRALFGLSAHPSVKKVFDRLLSPKQRIEVRVPLPETGELSLSPATSATFSIPGLLRAAESQGINVPEDFAKATQKLLSCELRPYQVQSLYWMVRQESRETTLGGGVRGLNGYFWEKRSFHDGGAYWYFPLAGHVLLEPPPSVFGGLLCEAMGLGKTIVTLALVARPDDDRTTVQRPGEAPQGGTLVVVPVSLYAQWLTEAKTRAPSLSVLAYDPTKQRLRPENVAAYDLVVAKMSTVMSLKGNVNGTRDTVLARVKWRRLVVDEAQFVRNDTSAIARSVACLDAQAVWMLSGTPLTNKIDDLQGILALLRVWPFTLGRGEDTGWQNHFWETHCLEPWQRKHDDMFTVVRTLVRATLFRHGRDQLCNGKPLVDLPSKMHHWIGVKPGTTASELYCRKWLETKAIPPRRH